MESFTDIELGSKADCDFVYRLRGFMSGEEVASHTTSDGIVYSIISLGAQRLFGVNELQGEQLNINNKEHEEHFLKNYDEIVFNGGVSDGAWLSIDCETPDVVSERISDDLVIGSLQEAKEMFDQLEEVLRTGGSHDSFWFS